MGAVSPSPPLPAKHPVARSRALTWIAFAVVLGAAALIRLRTSTFHAPNLDEFQHLHVAWCVSEGWVPYRDFWDNHPPALHWLLTTVIDPAGPPSQSFYSARRLMIPFALGTVAAVYALGALVFGRWAGAAAAIWLATSELVAVTTCEIRPDGPWACLLVLGMGLTLYAGRAKSPLRALAVAGLAGLFSGMAVAFSTKALAPLGILTVILLWRWLREGGQRRQTRRYVLSGFAPGLLAPVLVCAAIEAARGALAAAIRFTLLDNVSYPDRFNPWPRFAELDGAGLLLAGGAGIIWTLVACRRTAENAKKRRVCSAVPPSLGPSAPGSLGPFPACVRADAVCLAAVTLGAALVYFFIMPAPYPQSALLFVPMLAVFAGAATAKLVQQAAQAPPRSDEARPAGRGEGEGQRPPIPDRHLKRRVSAAAALALFAWLGLIRPFGRLELRARGERLHLITHLSILDVAHEQTSPRDVIFDGNALAVFRRHALFRPVLVKGVLMQYEQGRIQPSIRDELRQAGCTVVFADTRSRSIPAADWAYVESHYLPTEDHDWMLVPGRAFSPEETAGDGTAFSAPAAGNYRVWRSEPDAVVWVDPYPVYDEVRLEAGEHRIRAEGLTAVVLWRPMAQ